MIRFCDANEKGNWLNANAVPATVSLVRIADVFRNLHATDLIGKVFGKTQARRPAFHSDSALRG